MGAGPAATKPSRSLSPRGIPDSVAAAATRSTPPTNSLPCSSPGSTVPSIPAIARKRVLFPAPATPLTRSSPPAGRLIEAPRRSSVSRSDPAGRQVRSAISINGDGTPLGSDQVERTTPSKCGAQEQRTEPADESRAHDHRRHQGCSKRSADVGEVERQIMQRHADS